MQGVPQTEHHWLQQLLGEWTFETECIMGPDQPPMKQAGTEVVRSLGGLWTVGEGKYEDFTSIMTLGYDPKIQRFIGTFVASMMTHLWLYNGTLDASGKILTLDAEGPGFPDGNGMAKFQDIVEIIDADHRTLSSRVLKPDGTWVHFMTAHYHRVSAK